MKFLETLKKQLLEELKKTEKALFSIQIARNNAPTPMESKSDMSRARLENEIVVYEFKIRNLKKIINLIPTTQKGKAREVKIWSLVTVRLPTTNLKLIMVPEGLGGRKIGKIQCITEKSPIGSALMGKKERDEFTFNENIKGKVISIS